MSSRRASPIWDFFKDDPDDYTFAICQIDRCKHPKISRGKSGTPRGGLSISSLTSHLATSHKSQYKEYLEKKKAAAEKENNLDNDSEMEKQSSTCLRSNSAKEKFLSSQMSLDGWVCGSNVVQRGEGNVYNKDDPRAKDGHRSILMMCSMDLQPFTIVEDPGFLTYSYVLNPHFKPGTPTFYRDLLKKVYVKGKDKIVSKIVKDKPEAVCAQLDGWTENQNSYIGLIVNYITNDWRRVNLSLNCSKFNARHTGENLSIWLEEKLEEWKVLDKTTVVVSDSAANMLKIMDFLDPSIHHCKCLNHVLNTVVKAEILEKPEIKTLIEKARKISSHPNCSNLFAEALRRQCVENERPELKLIRDVATRWNSTVQMLKRLGEMKDIVTAVLDEDEWCEKILDGEEVTDREWRLLNNVVKVLEPFEDATLKLSREDACISEYIPTVTCLIKSLEAGYGDTGVVSLKSRLKANLENRTDYLEDSEPHALATLLDVRFKNKFFRSLGSQARAETRLKELVKNDVEATVFDDIEENIAEPVQIEVEIAKKGALETIFARLREEANANQSVGQGDSVESVVGSYISSKLEEKNLLWWEKYSVASKDSPIKLSLCKVARKFLTPPPTSTNTERMFSHAGNISERRAALKPETLEMLLFLGANLKLRNFALDW